MRGEFLGSAAAVLLSVVFVAPSQAQIQLSEEEFFEITQFYLDTDAIQDAALVVYRSPEEDSTEADDRCVEEATALPVPESLKRIVSERGSYFDASGFDGTAWSIPFCDAVPLNYILFGSGPSSTY